MEKYANTCKFIFICDQLTNIIEPIRSRCLLIRVPLPTKYQIMKTLLHISNNSSHDEKGYLNSCSWVLKLSPSLDIKLPSVIAFKEYVSHSRRPAFTRFNVFLRDKFCCQYCNVIFPADQLTFDHIRPRSLGGRTTWTNVVTACRVCNFKKGNKLLNVSGVNLIKNPERPSPWILQQNGRAFPPNYLHHSWRDYLYWDTELEK